MNEFYNKRVLVTGGTGLIGRQVVDLLVKGGANLTIACLDDLKFHSHGRYFRADLTDMDNARLAVKEQEYVFALAGVKASPKITLEKGDLMSSVTLAVGGNVIQACQEVGIKNVLFTSSVGAYAESELLKEEDAYKGKPMDAPGESKRQVERLIQQYHKKYGLTYKVVRIANCFGPGDNFDPENGMFISSLMAKVLRGDDPVEVWGDGSQQRDFIYSKDVARGIIHMMLNAPDCSPVNIGHGMGYTVAGVVSSLQKIIRFNIQYDKTKPTGVAKRVLSISKAKSLGWMPQYSLYDGLRETWDWFRTNPTEYKGRLNYFIEDERAAERE